MLSTMLQSHGDTQAISQHPSWINLIYNVHDEILAE